jgi:hypothetical protein
MKERFTKGPWRPVAIQGINTRAAEIIGPDGEFIANTGNWKKEVSSELYANANLIAVAPAMYEALNDILDLENSIGGDEYCGSETCKKCKYTARRFNKIRLILAKARGEST